MTVSNVIPTTLDGIKRYAKVVKTNEGIPHSKALDKVARLASYENFRHAQKLLKGNSPAVPHAGVSGNPFRTFLTAYWIDPKTGQSGRETLSVDLNIPWRDLLTNHDLRRKHELRSFKPSGPDHFVYREVASGQWEARQQVCKLSRVLEFVAACQLRPASDYRQAYPKVHPFEKVPGEDHASVWIQPSTQRYVIVDEPYPGRIESKAELRAAWATKYNYKISESTWPGIHSPGGTRFYLISHREDGVSLDPLLTKLAALGVPPTVDDWRGNSAPYRPIYVTPGNALTRPASKPFAPIDPWARRERKSTVPYRMQFGEQQRKPNFKMPIHWHKKIGALLKEMISGCELRAGIKNRLESVRNDLDDWAQCEYRVSELSNEEFFDLYYHEQSQPLRRSIPHNDQNRYLAMLQEAHQILSDQYPDCAPLRHLLGKLDGARKSLQTWRSKPESSARTNPIASDWPSH